MPFTCRYNLSHNVENQQSSRCHWTVTPSTSWHWPLVWITIVHQRNNICSVLCRTSFFLYVILATVQQEALCNQFPLCRPPQAQTFSGSIHFIIFFSLILFCFKFQWIFLHFRNYMFTIVPNSISNSVMLRRFNHGQHIRIFKGATCPSWRKGTNPGL